MATSVQSENEYEDLLAMWSDLESGLGIILSNPGNTQEFAHRVLQYDRWMQGLMRRDPDVGLYLLFQLSSNSPVGYSASHALVCAVLCHMIASELRITAKDRDSLVRDDDGWRFLERDYVQTDLVGNSSAHTLQSLN